MRIKIMRTTRRELGYLFVKLCSMIDKKVSLSPPKTGGWALKYNTVPRGYVIVEILDNGAISHPFGERIRTAGEMADVMRFAITALSIEKD